MQVGIEMKPKPVLTHDHDVIVKVTSCTICSGSDSHLYSGEIPAMRAHSIMGHEGMGIVESKGAAVSTLKEGDRVVIAFDIACGTCEYCQRKEFSGCAVTNDSKLTEATYGHCPCAIFGYRCASQVHPAAHSFLACQWPPRLRLPNPMIMCLSKGDAL